MRSFAVAALIAAALSAGPACAQRPPEAVGENLFPMGDIREAGGRPAGWSGPCQLSRDAHSPPWALLVKADRDGEIVRVNASLGRPVHHGVLSFWLKVLKRPEGVAHPFAMFVIALRGGHEAAPRAAWYLPINAPVGRWQRITLRFHFPEAHDDVVIAPRIGEGCAAVSGAYLLDDVAVYQLGPLAAGTLAVGEPMCLDGRPMQVTGTVRNDGGLTLRAGRVEIVAGERPVATTDVVKLEPGEQAQVKGQVTARPGRVVRVRLVWRDGRGQQQLDELRLAGARTPQAQDCEPAWRLERGRAWLNAHSCGLAMGQWALVFPIAGMRATAGFLVVRGNPAPQAVLALPAAMRPESTGGTLRLSAPEVRVEFAAAGKWSVRAGYTVDEPDEHGSAGPALYLGVGQGSHGRTWALFPGLEFLPPNEDSSSWLYAVPPHCWRWKPDPRKVTVPLMAADTGRAVVGLLWDELAAGMPQPYFGSPNRREGQAATAMRLELAQERTEVLVFCRPGGHVLDVVDEWMAHFELAPMPKTKRDLREELQWLGEPVEPHRTALSREVRGLVRAARKAAATQDADGGWRYAGPDDKVRDWLLRRVAAQLERARKVVGDERAFTLEAYGRAGDTALGQCVFFGRLETMARAALLSGRPELVEAVLRGLEFCDRYFQRPEGAETWEIPLHAPDLLAAAHAVPPYLDAYEMTGDRRYLERAVYWARTGLPFIYLWAAPDRDHMSYASIPVFGASYFVAPWFGRSVQFIGMHYARALMRLAEYDRSRPWLRIAEGITRRCITMQVFEDLPDPKKRFYYPDSWGQVDDSHTGPDIHPGDIKANCLILLGLNASAQTAVWQTARGRLHITVEGRVISRRGREKGGELVVETRFADPEILAAGPAAQAARIWVDGRAVKLPRVGSSIFGGRVALNGRSSAGGKRRIMVRWEIR